MGCLSCLPGTFSGLHGNYPWGNELTFQGSKRTNFGATAALTMLAVLLAPSLHAQAPPGPLPQTSSQDSSTAAPAKAPAPAVPRTKMLAGTWRLNLDESDDPAKKIQQSRGSDSGQGGGGRGGGGMGGGWPSGGGRGGGGNGGRPARRGGTREGP